VRQWRAQRARSGGGCVGNVCALLVPGCDPFAANGAQRGWKITAVPWSKGRGLQEERASIRAPIRMLLPFGKVLCPMQKGPLNMSVDTPTLPGKSCLPEPTIDVSCFGNSVLLLLIFLPPSTVRVVHMPFIAQPWFCPSLSGRTCLSSSLIPDAVTEIGPRMFPVISCVCGKSPEVFPHWPLPQGGY
jgi:hypothetical protein